MSFPLSLFPTCAGSDTKGVADVFTSGQAMSSQGVIKCVLFVVSLLLLGLVRDQWRTNRRQWTDEIRTEDVMQGTALTGTYDVMLWMIITKTYDVV